MPHPTAIAARTTVPINSRLNQRLTAYVAAASAAGAAFAVPQAEAKVVYTPTQTTIVGATPIDLNHDGTPDFSIGFHTLSKALVLEVGPAVKGNEILLGKNREVAVGIFGQPVGPGEKFAASTGNYGWMIMADAGSYSVTWFFGPWANATNRYLGFKFNINGEAHYGWARLTVGDYLHSNTAIVLTGYAYETQPNTKIIDGHLSDGTADNFAPADPLAPAPQPASLGMLARGADRLAAKGRRYRSMT
jgi:hypothetical protein